MAEKTNEHREVLAQKGNAIKSPRGLQIWGAEGGDLSDDPSGDAAGGHGNASMGTAARQAKIGHMAGTQDEKPAEEKETREDDA